MLIWTQEGIVWRYEWDGSVDPWEELNTGMIPLQLQANYEAEDQLLHGSSIAWNARLRYDTGYAFDTFGYWAPRKCLTSPDSPTYDYLRFTTKSRLNLGAGHLVMPIDDTSAAAAFADWFYPNPDVMVGSSILYPATTEKPTDTRAVEHPYARSWNNVGRTSSSYRWGTYWAMDFGISINTLNVKVNPAQAIYKLDDGKILMPYSKFTSSGISLPGPTAEDMGPHPVQHGLPPAMTYSARWSFAVEGLPPTVNMNIKLLQYNFMGDLIDTSTVDTVEIPFVSGLGTPLNPYLYILTATTSTTMGTLLPAASFFNYQAEIVDPGYSSPSAKLTELWHKLPAFQAAFACPYGSDYGLTRNIGWLRDVTDD